MLDFIWMDWGLGQIFYNVQDRKKNKEQTSSTRVHLFTDSCICGQNYCHTETLGIAQQNRYNLFLNLFLKVSLKVKVF